SRVTYIAQWHRDGLGIGDAGKIDNALVRVAANGGIANRTSSVRNTAALNISHRVREREDERVIAVRSAAAAFDAVAVCKIDIECASAAVGFSRHDTSYLHRRGSWQRTSSS